ncbi:MAG: terminase small subunit [Aquincola sp.]|nr:terminase small subunit [Aquincola sp.]
MAKTTRKTKAPTQAEMDRQSIESARQESSARSIDILPSPDATQALTLKQQATQLAVIDRSSHESALEMIAGGKKLKRAIEEHWSRIKRSVDDLKRNILALERRDVAPVEEMIATLTQRALAYSNAERERVRLEEEALRQEAEAKARQAREDELAHVGLLLERLEAESDECSPRERDFVRAFLMTRDATKAAEQVGYKDPEGRGARLLQTPKISKAIAAAESAAEIRRQASAVAAQPLDIVVEKVEKQTGYVPGVSERKTYSCEVIDPAKFILAYLAGDIPTDAMVPNQTWLNKQAGQLQGKFEQAYPGCRLVTKQTIAG